MSDLQILKDRAAGLEAKRITLRNDEAVFLKVSGIDQEIEKSRKDIGEMEIDVQAWKEELDEFRAKKVEALAPCSAALTAKMNEILPTGTAVLEITDNDVFLGWKINGQVRPMSGLSGGESVMFQQALEHAFDADILLVESGELDGDNLVTILEKYKDVEKQIIVNSCHSPGAISDAWNIVGLGG